MQMKVGILKEMHWNFKGNALETPAVSPRQHPLIIFLRRKVPGQTGARTRDLRQQRLALYQCSNPLSQIAILKKNLNGSLVFFCFFFVFLLRLGVPQAVLHIMATMSCGF
jgi:hypothetical protein